MKQKVLQSKPERCPKCGGRIVPIIYGEPSHEMYLRSLQKQEIILGGCLIMTDSEGNIVSPQWGCIDCGEEFFVKGQALQE